MSNVSKTQKILQRLNMIEDTEMMRNDLIERLEKELKKPEDKMDVRLVEQLLDLLDVQEPTREEKTECWTAIQNGIQESKNRRPARRATLIAAVAALLVLVTIGTAGAFRWSFLQKLLGPLAETFGIYTTSSLNSGIDDQAPVEGITEYTFADTEYVQIPFDGLESMPKEEYGFRIVPAWAPERFEYVQGSIYEDPDIMRASVTYQCEGGILNLTSTYYFDEADVGSYMFEMEPEDYRIEYIGDWEISFFTNAANNRPCAAWIVENMQYMLQGDVSQDEMHSLIESMKT